jgi:hypothetical protein
MLHAVQMGAVRDSALWTLLERLRATVAEVVADLTRALVEHRVSLPAAPPSTNPSTEEIHAP